MEAPPEPEPFAPFARLESRHVYRSSWCNLRRDVVDLGDGSRQEYHVFEVPDAVVVVPELADGRLVLIAQYRYPHGRTHWEVPAGRIGPDEEPASAARRELFEEAGCSGGELVARPGFFPLNGISDHFVHVYTLRGCTLGPERALDASERIRVATFAPEAVRMLLVSGRLRDGFSALALHHHFADARQTP
ncbi:MAG TPA: NUDIX hydrolase [Planctomycetota bacterium]|nr:NUDIX hydrolase [Planctomycetota bacterium]